eukprot:m.223304 g.223304  ORF g.223304 m.223304 type:complete len:123 (+) comp17267_c1_seq3:45-413(+)
MSYFASMRSKMGDLKVKLSDRQKKAGLLAGDDEKLERAVFGTRDAYQTLLKRGQECHVVDEVSVLNATNTAVFVFMIAADICIFALVFRQRYTFACTLEKAATISSWQPHGSSSSRFGTKQL